MFQAKKSRDGELLEPVGQKILQQHGAAKGGGRNPEHGEGRDRPVGEPSMEQRGPYPCRDAEYPGQKGGRQHQLTGVGKDLSQDVRHGAVLRQGNAEVPVQDARKIAPKANVDGIVEAEALHEPRDDGRVLLLNEQIRI